MKERRNYLKVWFVGCFILCSLLGYSQMDRGTMGGVVSPLGTSTNASNGLNSASSSLLNSNSSNLNSDKFQSYSRQNEPKKLMGDDQFHKNTHTFTPNYLKREKEENAEGVTDQYFGDYSNSGEFIQLVYRDFGSVDGDVIRVYLDDDVIRGNVYLTGQYTGLIIDLIPGFNKIVIEALNQGTSGPNTAQFQVYDDKGKLITTNQWNLLTGGKATMIIVKN